MANEEHIKDARIVLLSASGVESFFDMRDLLDKRFPDTVFSAEQEIDLWHTIPRE
jgi:hypothetical protein